MEEAFSINEVDEEVEEEESQEVIQYLTFIHIYL